MKKLIWVLTLFFLCALFISARAYVWVDDFAFAAFFSLGFPFLYVGAFVLMILLLIIGFSWQGLVLVVGLVIHFNAFKLNIAFAATSNKVEHGQSLKCLTWNVRLFDLYNWSENTKTKEKMMQVLKKQSADVMTFQEYYHQSSRSNEFKTTSEILDVFKGYDHALQFSDTVKEDHFFGLAIYSKYKIVNQGKILFSGKGSNLAMFADLDLGDDTVRFYNIHLASFKFSKEDYAFIDSYASSDLKNQNQQVSIDVGGIKIIKRLIKGYQRRREQVGILKKHILKAPHKVVLMGDFNDTPNSHTYHILSASLSDAFLESGFGIGATYAGLGKFLRIDYILHDQAIRSERTKVIDDELLSDHYALTTTLKF